MRVVLATSNLHKIEEMTAILAGGDWTLLSGRDAPGAPEDPEETGATFEENAAIKARTWATATGGVALADDSGLEVEALGGEPGIRSARYAATPPERIAKLLRALDGLAADKRAARFVCVAALAWPVAPENLGQDARATGELRALGRLWEGSAPAGRGEADGVRWVLRRGVCPGRIGFEPRGEHGFGYDPVFRVDGCGDLTMAELPPDRKNALSHRGRALAALVRDFRAVLRS